MNSDTIVAIATANGIGSISIVRLSGSIAMKIALNISNKKVLKPRLATLSNLYNVNGELIDQALLLFFKAPNSFTGEDIVEFQSHGGHIISNMIVKETLLHGARLAQNGEFSKRAYLNNKIDLTQAEAISNMIQANSQNAVKFLARQLKGELKNFIDNVRKDLLFILANIEVSIDYAEEDLPDDIMIQMQNKLTTIEQSFIDILKNSKNREGLMQGFKIAIIGKPNVGKSSFLNSLLNYNRAIVSDVSGTTRDTIEENVKIGTHLVKIIDTAGIRNTDNKIEIEGINKSKEIANDADIIIAFFDNSREFDLEDDNIINILNNTDKEIVNVLNKIDLPSKFYTNKIDNFIEINCKNNVQLVIAKLEEILDDSNHNDELMLISTRQVQIIESSLLSIGEAIKLIKKGNFELLSFHINDILYNFSSITRSYEYDEMLDVMFGNFCLGK